MAESVSIIIRINHKGPLALELVSERETNAILQ